MKSASNRQRLGFQLVGLARRWRRHLDASLADAGLSDATWGPLVHLQEARAPLHQKNLALRMGLDGSSLVRLLDILEARELIQRRVDAQDRRAKLVALTPAGTAAVKRIRGWLTRLDEELLEDVANEDIEAVLRVFAQVERRLEALRPQPEEA